MIIKQCSKVIKALKVQGSPFRGGWTGGVRRNGHSSTPPATASTSAQQTTRTDNAAFLPFWQLLLEASQRPLEGGVLVS